MAERWQDLPAQLGALGALARRMGLRQLVLRTPATLTWLFGARVHVPQTLDTACLDAVVQLGPDGATQVVIVTNAIEAPRLRDTELADVPASWEVLPWWQARDSILPSGAGVGSDRPSASMTDVSAEVAALRRVLTATQQDRLGVVCRDAAAAATRAAYRIAPGHTEYDAAGVLARELLAAELDPVVLMVAGGGRGGRHRHPLPTSGLLGSRAMLVCCARRHGLIASVTRFVSFEPLSESDADAYRRLLAVERTFLDASLPGARLGDVVTAGMAAYGLQGLGASEWERHHQGGLSGWVPREFPAHPRDDLRLREGMVVGWNPSSERWKVEDTSLIRPDGPRPLVHDPQWPTLLVGGRTRPDVLIRD